MSAAGVTHTKGQLVGNQNAGIEAIMGLLSGMAYGLVNPLVGHPFNLVQTRMQADVAYKGRVSGNSVLQLNHTVHVAFDSR